MFFLIKENVVKGFLDEIQPMHFAHRKLYFIYQHTSLGLSQKCINKFTMK